MQNAFKAYREGRSQMLCCRLVAVPHSNLQRCLRTGQDKLLKNKNRRTMFTPELQLKLSRIVKLSAHGFRVGYNNGPIYHGIEE